ncbi:hypothetical protein GJ842_22460 [Salmonella enterica]|nr:hypothetical protein [Salmonella enterica]
MMISIEAAEKQLSPLEELIAIHGKFISLREMVEQIKRRYSDMTYGQVALWLINKTGGLDEYHRCDFQVEKSMRERRKGLLQNVVKHGAEVMNNNNQFDEICVRRENAERILSTEFPVMAEFLPPLLAVNDCTYQDDEYHHADNSVSDINNDISPPAVWENTHGMETANKLIAGLAIANAINDKRCQRKDGLNKSAVARVAGNALLKYGGSIGVSDRQLTALISEALKCAPKLKDYTDSEQP